MSHAVTELTTDAFDAFINQEQPVLVDFWAPWCGPCRVLAPTLESLAATHPGRIAKVNVDDAPDIAARFGIASIPTVILFDKGQASEVMVGLRPQQAYEQALAG